MAPKHSKNPLVLTIKSKPKTLAEHLGVTKASSKTSKPISAGSTRASTRQPSTAHRMNTRSLTVTQATPATPPSPTPLPASLPPKPKVQEEVTPVDPRADYKRREREILESRGKVNPEVTVIIYEPYTEDQYWKYISQDDWDYCFKDQSETSSN